MKQDSQTINQAAQAQTHGDLAERLLTCLNDREQEVLRGRYALKGGKKKTLEAIGENYAITRERVRQIERASLQKVKRLQNYKQVLEGLLTDMDALIEKFGGVIAEQHLIEELLKKSGKKEKKELDRENNRLVFLLEGFVGDVFHPHKGDERFESAWSKEKHYFDSLHGVLDKLENFLQEHGKPTTYQHIAESIGSAIDSVQAHLHLSKKTDYNPFGQWGMKHWSEVNPKRMADRIYLVLKKYVKPLHYKEIAKYIEKYYNKKAHPPTVHNELIADARFVLVGRGMYALKEWGYKTGTVKEIVENVLKESAEPLMRDEIIDKVQKQRVVARSTILLALNSNKNVEKAGKDSYKIKS